MKKFISVLLSVLLFFCTVTLVLVLYASTFFTAKNMEKEFIKIDLTKVNVKNQTGEVVPEKNSIDDTIGTVYKTLEGYNVPKEVIDELINSKFGKQFVGTITGNITEYIITGREKKVLTSGDFNTLVDDNIDLIIEKSGQKISIKQKDQMVDYMKSNSNILIDSLPTTKEVAKELPAKTLDAIQMVFSKEVKAGLEITIAVLIVLICITNCHKGKWILYIFIPTLVASLCLAGAALAIKPILTIALSGESQFILYIIDNLAKSFQVNVIRVSGLLFGVSLFFLICYKVWKTKTKKRQCSGILNL